MIRNETRLATLQGCVDIPPSSQPDRALSTLTYGLKQNYNLSQLCHERTDL
jgi:hypothetical protein